MDLETIKKMLRYRDTRISDVNAQIKTITRYHMVKHNGKVDR